MSTTPMRTAVIGTGALGRHHVRIHGELAETELVGIYDTNQGVAQALADEHGTTVVPSFEALLDAGLQAAVLAVPTVEHAKMGLQLLDAGVHVLVEKPIAATVDEAEEMIAAAEAKGLVLAVGHVEFHNPAVQALLEQGLSPRFLETQRLGTFSPRSLDIDVILDLMIHDLQILHALDPSPVREIRASGIEVLSHRIDIANARIELESGCVANLTASRVSAQRNRKLRVFGPHLYCSLDYQEQSLRSARVVPAEPRPEIIVAPVEVPSAEPLKAENQAFLAACRGEPSRYVDGRSGLRALRTALAVVEAIST
ncbi:MAG: Gfo/Idh/MocA family oxidoreductase [Acidobacteriota bacterium]